MCSRGVTKGFEGQNQGGQGLLHYLKGHSLNTTTHFARYQGSELVIIRAPAVLVLFSVQWDTFSGHLVMVSPGRYAILGGNSATSGGLAAISIG